MLEIVQRIRSKGAGPEVLVVTQPSLRRKTNKALWISKWNLMSHIPFKFHQTCSCKTGNSVEGCHLTCYVGCSKAVDSGPCSEVPTLSTTSQAAVDSLSGTILHLIASMQLTSRSGGQVTGEVERLTPENASARLVKAPTLCHSTPQTGIESQQTLDSAQHPIHSEEQAAFPTDAKVEEKARRKEEKEQGIEKVVKKRLKIMEDHHDDCGDDLSSLNDNTEALLMSPPLCRVTLTPMMLYPMKTTT